MLLSNLYLQPRTRLHGSSEVVNRGRSARRSPSVTLHRATSCIWLCNIDRTLCACRKPCAFGWVSSRLYTGYRQDRSGRRWSVRAATRGQTRQNAPGNDLLSGPTLYCTRNRKGNFKVADAAAKSRLRRSLMSLQELMRRVRHHRIGDQVSDINAALRGHYAYYGVAGNIRALFKVYRAVERYWHRMLRSRSCRWPHLGRLPQIKQRTPLLRPKLRLPYRELQELAVL